MTWAPLTTEAAFLLLSVLSGTAAAVILLRDMASSRFRKTLHGDLASTDESHVEVVSRGRLSNLLDRITLLNKNLIQCPSCLRIDHAHARFCNRCGALMKSYEELPTDNTQAIEARYLAQDESTKVYGLSMNVDSHTRIGVLVGIQTRDLPQNVNRT